MDQLILCEHCRHGATLHAGDGCAVPRCACGSSRHAIVDRLVDLVRDDAHNLYRSRRTAEP